MNSLEIKSTGALIDEYITSTFKNLINPTVENFQRYTALYNVCNERLGDRRPLISNLYDQLTDILWQCWQAQERINEENPYLDLHIKSDEPVDLNSITRLAYAGKMAQKTNAIRCQLVRKIDQVLGESDRTYLEKTYK